MKIWFSVILLLVSGLLTCDVVKNGASPYKGHWDFKIKKEWSINSFKDMVFSGIRGIEVDKGKIFVWDSRQFKVFVFSEQGKFLCSFVKKGEGPGEVMDSSASRLYLADEMVIIHEMNTGRVNYFSYDGKYLLTRMVKGSYSHYVKCYIDGKRFVFFRPDKPESKTGEWGIYNLAEQRGRTLGTIPVDETIRIKERSMVIRNSAVLPSAIFGYSQGKIIWGRNNRYNIKIYNVKRGQTDSFSIDRSGADLTLDYKMKMFEYLKPFLEKKYISKIVEMTPDSFMKFNRILADEKGMLYFFVPGARSRKSILIDIFSPEGVWLYLGVITIPDGYCKVRSLIIRSDACYFCAEDESGEISLIKCAIKTPTVE